MYNSNSFIQESIYQSQTHSIKKGNFVPAPTTIRQTSRELMVSNKPDQKAFRRYYQENMELKNQQKQMMVEIKELKEKVSRNNQNTRLLVEGELKTLAQGKKSQWDNKKPLSRQVRGQSTNKGSSTKVEHLLEIIDHYKTKLLTAEEQIKNLKRQKHLLQQDVKLKDRQFVDLKEQKPEATNFQQEINLNQKLKRNIREMELEKERSKFLELAIKNLEAKLRTTELKFQEIDGLKSENRSLEQKIIRMTQLPSFNSVIDKAEEQRKAKQLQNKLKQLNERYSALKDTNLKVEAELKLLQNKVIESASEIDDLQKQNQKLREQSINNPLILKLNKNPELIQKIIMELQNQKRSGVTKQPQNAKMQIERLIMEKEQMANQILNYQSKIDALQENYREKERLSKLQKEEPVMAVNQAKATSKQGIIYDGDVNVFSEKTVNIPPGVNFFDLFLGQLNLLESMVQTVANISNFTNPIILATVDFYNHNTQHSKLTQGCRCDLQSQFAFRITQDDFFFKYLQKSTFQIDVWASEGSKNYHLGKANIDLKHLLSRARPKISAVISTSAPLFLNQKVLGSINIVMRMRLPIFEQYQKIKDLNTTTLQNKEESVIRRLVIQIDEGRGFGERSNTFVYYSFRLEDYYTKASKGNSPAWNHIKMLEVNYDTDFKNYLRKNELEFTVFDDNVLVTDDNNSDVVGSAVISFLPLLEGKPIRQKLQIRKGNQRKGTIDIKVFWYEVQDNGKDANQVQGQKKLSPKGIHEQIRSFMKEHEVNAQKVYRLIDDNRTGLISFEEFQDWIFKISTRRFTYETINAYYKEFKQPLNVKNFIMKIDQEYEQSSRVQQQPIVAIVAGIGKINEFLKINSTQMKKRTLQQYLAEKNVLEVMNEIQTDRAGYVSKQKLLDYFQQNNISAEITSQRVKLIDFLKKNHPMQLTI